MFLRFFIVFIAFVSVLGVSAKMGGWSPADVSSPEVLEAANFAVGAKFPDIRPTFKVTEANKQVVAGMKYDLTVETTRGNGKCEVDHFQVWNRFGKFTLVEHEVLKQTCKAART